MNSLRRFGVFWYHFIVGDDWRIAVGVVLGLSLTTLIVHGGHTQAWWLLPIMVIIVLTISLWLATKRH